MAVALVADSSSLRRRHLAFVALIAGAQQGLDFGTHAGKYARSSYMLTFLLIHQTGQTYRLSARLHRTTNARKRIIRPGLNA